MIIKGVKDADNEFRIFFGIDKNNNVKLKHFVVRITTPGNPFKPHKHEQEELWFIINGHGVFTEDGNDYSIESDDLIQIKPWVLHGLKTDSSVKWICLG